MNKDVVFGFALIVSIVLLFIGWVFNMVEILRMTTETPIGIIAARIIGVFIAPMGGVFGWVL